MLQFLRILSNNLEWIVCQWVAFFQIQKFEVHELPHKLPDVSIIQPDELGKFKSFKTVYFLSHKFDCLLIKFFTATKEKSVDRLFSVPQENWHFSIGDILSSGHLGQISQFVDEEVDSNVGTDFEPF